MQQDHEPTQPAISSEDYGYDLAHEVESSQGSAPVSDAEHHESVHVSTETEDRGQDYSYDLAHDIPRSPGQ